MTLKTRLLSAAAALAVLPAAAHADGVSDTETAAAQPGQIEVIRVTTQFREQSLADVPVNVAAFDSELIDTLAIQDFESLALFTPGLVVQEQSPNNTGYSIRGITTDSGDATAETRVAIFQDGVSITRSRGSYVELFDIERVEVAKGPQPTLFGRGALIGGINIIQNKAEDDFSASFNAGWGNLGQVDYSGHVNYGLQEGYGVRLAAVRRERDGHIENVLGGRDLQGKETWAIRGVFSGQPTDYLSFDIIANYQEDTPPGTAFKSGTFPAPGGDTDPFTPAALQTFGGFEGGRELGLDRTVMGLTALAELRLNPAWTLNSITGWRSFDSVEIFDPDGSALPLVVIGEDATGDQFSQELRLSYDGGGRLTGSVGGLIFAEDGTQRIPVMLNEAILQSFLIGDIAAGAGLTVPQIEALLGGATVTDPFNPFPLSILSLLTAGQQVPLRPDYQEEASNRGETTSYDIFADATYAMTDRLSVTGGLRWTYEDKRSSGYGRNLAGPNRVTGGQTLILPATPGGAEVSQSASFDAFTWRLAASYEAADNLNLWASYARGRRPDVIALDSSSPNFFTTAPAEIVDSVEAGAFLTLGRGTLSGSVFYSEYENFQTTRFDPNELSFVVDNTGNATQYGFEGQASVSLTDLIDVYASYAYNHATFDGSGGDGSEQELAGNTFRYAPRHAASIGVRAEVARGDWGSVALLPSYSWQSRIFFDEENDVFGGALTQGAYGLLRARVRYETADEGFYAELFGSNLTDEKYLIDAGNTGSAFGIPTFISAAPRLYGVRIGGRF